MRLKNFAMAIVLAATMMSGSGCGWNNVPPGYGGIKVNYYGSNKGVDDVATVTGMQVYNPFTTNIIEFPLFNQRAVWTRDIEEGSPTNEEISFTSKGDLPFTADIALSYELELDKLAHFYVKFRSDDIERFTHGYLRDIARRGYAEMAPKYEAEQLYGEKIAELDEKVRNFVNSQVSEYGIKITNFGIIGRPRPPKEIVDRINGKVASIQKAQQAENELRERTAEAAKRVADAKGDADSQIARAEGEAKANAILSASINDNLIRWRSLQVMAQWNGQLPTYLATGDSGLPIPMMNVGQ